ncbi:MAG: helix-turn-helix domain-containing protein [Taibaiella sp.]|nr:helix-turn-helix domain-containing protein [Taibaiella sp.]
MEYIHNNNLRYHRRIWRYSLKDIAFLLGLSCTSIIIRWEKGKEKPSHDNMLALAYIYRTSCDVLFEQRKATLRIPIHERELLLQKRRDAHE